MKALTSATLSFQHLKRKKKKNPTKKYKKSQIKNKH